MQILYTTEHEWVAVEANVATIGITDYAQRVLGDLVFIELPAVGATLTRGAVAGVVESVKAASDLYAPLSGSILEVNAATVAAPEIVNTDPMGAGWLFKIDLRDAAELGQLLDEAAYRRITA